jgi:hypothetical protein
MLHTRPGIKNINLIPKTMFTFIETKETYMKITLVNKRGNDHFNCNKS